MNDRLALLSAIHDHPDDDLPRLAYADWMEENGQAERAEFIRVHLAMERTPRGTPEYRRLWEREVDLIRTYKDAWFGTFRFNWSFYEVKRGFLDDISSSAEHVVPHARWLLENHAVQRLSVGSPDLDALGELLSSPLVATLWQLHYYQVPLPGITEYMSSYQQAPPPLQGAELPLARRPLDVAITYLAGEDLPRLLVSSPFLKRLTRLSLGRAQLGRAGTVRLLEGMADWPNLSQLILPAVTPPAQSARQRVVGTNLTPAGVVALVTAPQAARLRLLNLTGEDLDQAACEAFLDTPHLGGLETLWLTRPPPDLRELALEMELRFAGRLRWAGPEE